MSESLTFQDAILALQRYWGAECPARCLIWQPYNTEVGAGTMNPATFLRVLGPEPWNVGYVEPSVRPDDSRYGDNPNRLQMHTQYQVILKPDPGDPQELYLKSLAALGIDRARHDIRFVEDNWESPALGAWGLGWEVWLDGLEITQFTYFQQAGGFTLDPVSVEITYGLERIIMALQGAKHFKDIAYARDNAGKVITYGEVLGQNEYEMSVYNLDAADVESMAALFDRYEAEAKAMLARDLPVPAYNYLLKTSHAFNILDSRGAIGVTERARYFARMRDLARAVAQKWVEKREELGHPLGLAPKVGVAVPATPVWRQTDFQTFVLEIGTEELPPADVNTAVLRLEENVPEFFRKLDLNIPDGGRFVIEGTPRRLVVIAEKVPSEKSPSESFAQGPAVKVAYDPNGKPTNAAIGFANRMGVPVENLERREYPSGTYVFAKKRTEAVPAGTLLAEALPGLIAGIQFPKSMRWNSSNVTFSRPIRRILAMLGDQVIPFEYAGIVSGNHSCGLRNKETQTLEIPSADEFLEKIQDSQIVLKLQDRIDGVESQAKNLADQVGGQWEYDADLLQEVGFLVEAPNAILGSFEEKYLEMPKEVLTTVMKKHQRYFSVTDENGKLLPYFIAVANGDVDIDLVRGGNEAVLRARYADAAFFWNNDIKRPLESFREKLKNITFQAKLGSMLDKNNRLEKLAQDLARRLVFEDGTKFNDALMSILNTASHLAKADLATEMVIEMTSLAGVMGREYARREGWHPGIPEAIFEHTLPRSAGDKLPESKPGIAIALADRFDSLVGLFAIGLAPKATADPFALRRAALGIVQTLIERNVQLDLREAIHLAAAQQPVEVKPETEREVFDFIVRRLEQWLLEQGQRFDLTQAALAALGHDPARAVAALKELAAAAAQPAFTEFLPAYSRCARILRGQTPGRDVEESLFDHDSERQLWKAVQGAEKQLEANPAGVADFMAAFQPLVAPINTFFDDVMVMAEDPKVRANRLALVNRLASLADGIADFSKVEGF